MVNVDTHTCTCKQVYLGVCQLYATKKVIDISTEYAHSD